MRASAMGVVNELNEEDGSLTQAPGLRGTNVDLIGAAGSRDMLDTPCLLVDLTVLTGNIQQAAEMAGRHGKAFRPHAKSHKCIEIAKRQIVAGAVGISVASIGEAEVFAAAGISNILITSTFATDRQIERVLRLLKNGADLQLVLDHRDIASRLNQALGSANLSADVLIDIDMGRKRSGCVSESDAADLATAINAASCLQLKGIQTYAGHLSHMISYTERAAAAEDAVLRSGGFLRAVSAAVGCKLTHCSGGSTGASLLDIHDPVLTELQWGSYIFMDVEYSNVEFDSTSARPPFTPALFVATRIISANTRGKYTMDAGDKRFANKYGAEPAIAFGAPQNAFFKPVSDEHGLLEVRDAQLSLGDRIEVMVPHCDPTVNLYDHIHIVEKDRLVDIWPVAARGVY